VSKNAKNPYFTRVYGTFEVDDFSEIPMNFDGDVSSTRNTLSNHDFVDQNLHHFPCQMLYFDVFFDQFTAVVTNGNFDFNLGNSLLTFQHLRFQAFLLRGEVFRQFYEVRLANQPFYLVKVEVTYAFGR